MYGPDFLVSPVTTYNATSWSVYLPLLSSAHWKYYWNGTDVGPGGYRVVVDVSSIGDSTRSSYARLCRLLFQPATCRRCILHPAKMLSLAYLRSASPTRCRTVTYTVLFETEALAWLAPGPIVIDSTSYDTVAITNYWSATLTDNADSIAGPPDASYTVSMANGYALSEKAPGTIPLLQFFRRYNATHVDTADGRIHPESHGLFRNGYAANGTLGFVLPASTS